VPSIKPHTIIQERVRNDLNVPVVPRTDVKPTITTPEKVDPVIKNIIKEVAVIIGISPITLSFKVKNLSHKVFFGNLCRIIEIQLPVPAGRRCSICTR
jgi:hypothetical protein